MQKTIAVRISDIVSDLKLPIGIFVAKAAISDAVTASNLMMELLIRTNFISVIV